MDRVYELLIERNACETKPFVSVHESNAALQNLVDNLQYRCDSSAREQLELQHRVSQLSGDGGNNKKANAAFSKAEARMRDKIEKLQEQLNEKLRADLKTAKELSELKDYSTAQEATIANLRDVNDRDENTIASLTTQLGEAQAHSRLAEKQYNGLKETIERLQEENDELKKVNTQLVDRVVTEKEKMIEQLNKMNEMVEKLQRENEMLRTLQKQENERRKAEEEKQKGGIDLVGKGGKSPHRSGGGVRRFGASGVFLPSEPKHIVQAHPMEATSVRYDGTGMDLVATGSSDSTVKVWDTNNGQLKATLRGGSGHPMLGVDLSGGLAVGCGADKTCRVWNIRTQRMIHQLAGHTTKVTCVRLFNSERDIITGSADRSMKVWDIARSTYRQTTTFRHSSTSNCIDVSPDSSTVFSGHMDGGIRLWDIRSEKRVLDVPSMHDGGVTSVQCNPRNGNQVLTNGRDSILKVIDVRTCTAIQTLGHAEFRTAFNYSSCAISPDGSYALAGSGTTGDVFVWDIADGHVKKKLKAHEIGVGGVAWGRGGSNGQQVATVDRNGALVLWA